MNISIQKIYLEGWIFILISASLLGIVSESSLAVGANPSPDMDNTNAVYIAPSVLSALEHNKSSQAQAADTKVRVIATFKTAKDVSGALRANAIKNDRASVLEALPNESYKVISDFKHIPAVSMKINRSALDALRVNPAVAAINEDREVFPTMTETNVLTGVGSVQHRFITIKYSSVIKVPLYT